MSTESLPVLTIIFFAVFVQSLSGFGAGLVAMPLLTELLGLDRAAPLVAAIGILLNLTLTLYYRYEFQISAVLRLTVSALVAIPFGLSGLQFLDPEMGLKLLGAVILTYAAIALILEHLNISLPRLDSPQWAYGFGFASGLLSGAYNTGGPPVVIYGACRRWNPAVFKSNINGFFMVSTAMVIVNHALHGNYTETVFKLFLYALPVMAIAIVAGLSLSKFINPVAFRTLILILLVAVGLRLLFQ
ncbi:sulfite exporter TauE/SafE family protein [Lyngbya sp. CCY1209]|uniref:sulfite exporter TauE/SafE family protein n=1 Tax=Lyngbya sp. CCY1209 TaxID=2886103 RepID=UPI002D20FD64|nr:sulfite exporter TauE/SafE family protein [Lyngbya sp. CCY1209]MEB3886238.1 sulfite exporter TauE/SafE family protein [Lyngbya sp. CCY1209]